MTTAKDELLEAIACARNMVVLTGAGISTESGIPDFRSPGGIWSRYRIIQFNEFMASEAARIEDWQRRFEMEDQLGVVRPNPGHLAIAGWVGEGRCSTLVTQNIDGLHQEAGTPSDAVIEIHGNARSASCTRCGLEHTIAECRAVLEETGRSPACRECGSIVKSNVVMFGEMMPERETQMAFDAAEACDLFLAIGTSLQVHPAAGLPLAALSAGARLAILNREPTGLDAHADIVVHAGIGETIGQAT